MSQIFPGNLLEPTYIDPDDHDKLLARSEVERREEYIKQLDYELPKGGNHPLVLLAKRCLQNDPVKRPTADELVTTLDEMRIDLEGPYGDVTRADAVRQVIIVKALKKKETHERDNLRTKDAEIQELQQELEHTKV